MMKKCPYLWTPKCSSVGADGQMNGWTVAISELIKILNDNSFTAIMVSHILD